ncbi:MAG: hypothetical protein NT148_02095 [Candidatus Nealsonbacteria bacterium]|nr:hypothetical protein [Candidatus Nealsonbacteria bacterium]
MNKKMPKSLRRYVRTEKARIRRVVLSIIEQDKQINDMYLKLAKKPEKPVVEAVKKPEVKAIKPKVKTKVKA